MLKKIISYSLWGANPLYTHGAIHNANLVTTEFPGWIMRVYYNNTVPLDVINILQKAPNVELIEIDDKEYSQGTRVTNAYFYRYYVQDDESVERYICRDLDWRLSKNDKACIDEWIDSKIPFHLMRPVSMHNVEMMAGLWGVVRNQLPINMFNELKDYFSLLSPNQKGPDQNFLRDKIFPLIKGNCLVHGLDFNYNSGVVKDFIYGSNLRENYKGTLLPSPAGCVFDPEIETWEEGWEKDNRVSFNKEKWYNSIRK